MLLCNQGDCAAPAAFLFTWPGRDEAGICAEHARRTQGIAEAMGFSVHVRPLYPTPVARETRLELAPDGGAA